jgi:valyl-tRNA synthetase
MRKLIEENASAIQNDRQANVGSIAFVESSLAKLPGARHTARFDVHLVYEQKIDVAAECARLKKELEKLEKDIASAERQLSDPGFTEKAPAAVVEGRRKHKQENETLREKTQSKRKELGCT